MHPPIAADLCPCADGSAVRTALVAWPRRCAPSWPRWDCQVDRRTGGSRHLLICPTAGGIKTTAFIGAARIVCRLQSKVYVHCPSVCMSQHGPTAAKPPLQIYCCGPGRQEILINCCSTSGRMRAVPHC